MRTPPRYEPHAADTAADELRRFRDEQGQDHSIVFACTMLVVGLAIIGAVITVLS
jgi:hypothetical protein